MLDERRTNFGIRRLQLDPVQGLRINGATSSCAAHASTTTTACSGAAAIARAEERRIELLKDAGFNAIRSSHNPMSSALLDACDRLGMLVMDEAFDVWTESKSSFDYSLAFPEWWERDIEAMVAKDFNHPSVIIYSIGNEIPETGHPARRRMGPAPRREGPRAGPHPLRHQRRSTAVVVRPLDKIAAADEAAAQAPPVTARAASTTLMADAGRHDERDQRLRPSSPSGPPSPSPCSTSPGMNYAEARYALDRELFPNRVIVGTETFPTAHRRQLGAWSRKLGHVIGDFTWTGWDYLGEVGIGRIQYLDPKPRPRSQRALPLAHRVVRRPRHHRPPPTGLLLPRDRLRPAHRALHRGRRPRPRRTADPARTPWAWSDTIASWTWDGSRANRSRVEVYSDADEVELLVNDRSLGILPAGQDHRFRAVFDLPYEPGSIAAYAIRGGQRAERFALRSSVGGVGLAVTADRDVIRDDAGDLAYLDIELRDSAGTLVTDDDRTVTVTVDGAALAAVGSGRPDNLERFDQGTHSTYRGRAQAIIRPTGDGPVAVTVSADGLEPRELRLLVK